MTNLILEKVDNVDNSLLYNGIQLLLNLPHNPNVGKHFLKPKNKQILIDHFFKKGEIIRANFNNFASAVYALGKEEVEKKSK